MLWLWWVFLGILSIIMLLAYLIHASTSKKQKLNQMELESGEIVVIPILKKPLPAIVESIRSMLTGKLRGKGALTEFRKQFAGQRDHKVIQSCLLFFPMVIISDADLARQTLFAKQSEVAKADMKSRFIDRFLSKSILLAPEDDWKRHKAALSPAFAWQHIQSILPEFIKIVTDLQELWLKEEKSIKVFPWIKRATLDAIGKGGFGFDFRALFEGEETPEIKNYEELMEELKKPIHFFDKLDNMLGTRKKMENQLDLFEEFMFRLMKEKRELANDENYEPKDILDFLVAAQENNSLSDTEILHDMNTFFIAGHETTAGALNSAIHLLARSPEVQEKLRREIRSVCGDNMPTYEDIKSMSYLECCLKETLRLFPPAVMLSRSVIEDTQIGNLRIKKGTLLVINTVGIQMDTSIWGPDAEEFKPERFLPENRKQVPKNAYFPFSMGSRQCIGNNFAHLEMRAFLAVLLNKFSFEPDTDSAEDFDDFMGAVLTVNPECSLLVRSI